jgi:hypothetical protein
MAMIKAAPLPIAVSLLELLFITLAIAMKVHVIKQLHDEQMGSGDFGDIVTD